MDLAICWFIWTCLVQSCFIWQLVLAIFGFLRGSGQGWRAGLDFSMLEGTGSFLLIGSQSLHVQHDRILVPLALPHTLRGADYRPAVSRARIHGGRYFLDRGAA